MTTVINRNDYNNIRSQIDQILGTGAGSYGYGQALVSTALPAAPTPITVQDEQWDALYYDLVNILLHQNGTTPILPNVDGGDVIRLGASFPLSAYQTALTSAATNRFELALGQSVVSAKGLSTYGSAWVTQAQSNVTVVFSSADNARYFFNSGGKIRFSSSRVGGSSSSQNSSWTSLLDSVGTVSFGGNTPIINFYALTSSFQTSYSKNSSGAYGANSFRIETRCDVADNSSGGATTVYFRITWADSYVDYQPFPPNDQVDGTLSLTVEEQKASGSMQPTGTFSILGPTYTVSPITAS